MSDKTPLSDEPEMVLTIETPETSVTKRLSLAADIWEVVESLDCMLRAVGFAPAVIANGFATHATDEPDA